MANLISIRNQFEESKWPGGTTTQLYIYPDDGDYANRRFKVRISSASVEAEESQFTKLEGVKRQLMILDGEMKLVHKGLRERCLKPFEVETFMGDWDTVSFGKVLDFNLMLMDGAQGAVLFQEIRQSQGYVLQFGGLDELNVKMDTDYGTGENLCEQKIILYVLEGSGTIGDIRLLKKHLIVLDQYEGEKYEIQNPSAESLKLVICRIFV